MDWKDREEMLERFRARQAAAQRKVRIAAPTAFVWDVVGGGDADASSHAALLIRPWDGEILLSLTTVGSAPQALLRRPWLLEETGEE